MKKYFNTVIAIPVIVAMIGCSINTNSDNNVSKSYSTSSELKDILPPDKDCKSEMNNFSIKEEEIQQPSIVQEQKVRVSLSKLRDLAKSKKPKPRFDDVQPIDESIEEGYISLFFKDEYKIRMKKFIKGFDSNPQNDKFVSDSGEDLKELNKLIKDKNILVRPHIEEGKYSQEELDEQERKAEKFFETDIPNQASIYSIEAKKEDVKNIVEELRSKPYVLSANYYSKYGVTTGTFPSNEDIFTDGITLPTYPTGSFVTEPHIRYWYPRIGLDKARTLYNPPNNNKIKVAVIDVGFDTAHIDSPNYDMSNKLFCDTVSCYQGNVDVSPPTKSNGDWYENSNHGGRVAAIISANDTNNTGIAGVAPYNDVEIIPIRLSSTPNGDGLAPDIIALKHAIPRAVERGAKIINMSLAESVSQTIEYNQEIRTALINAYAAGVLCISSAGNYNNEIQLETEQTGLIVVGGTSKYQNNRWIESYGKASNYGTRVDISAPAEQIITIDRNNTYRQYLSSTGTSLSTPMVAGAAALLWKHKPNLSVNMIRNLLIYSSTLFQSDKLMGYNYGIDRFGNNIQYYNTYTPNGRLLNVGKAIELSNQIDPTKDYIRIHNTDSRTSLYINNVLQPYIFYKKDYLHELNFNTLYSLKLETYNVDCVYSWGYQFWVQMGNEIGVAEYTSGLAGKLNPTNSVVKKNQYIHNDSIFEF